MTEMLTSTGLFAVVLTLGTYEAGLWLRKKTGNALCNPLLISIILVMAVLGLLKIPAETYGAKMDGLSWILTPATVCLAVPLYEQVRVLKKNLPAIFAGVGDGHKSCLRGPHVPFSGTGKPNFGVAAPKERYHSPGHCHCRADERHSRRVYGGSDHHRYFRLRLWFRAL